MHYLIDGYNLLFRTLKKHTPLEKSRLLIITEFNEIVAELNLNITLVFDGAEKHLSLPSRGHFDRLEIVYTSQNQTADDYILEEVTLSSSPSQITVVSNDRELAGRCRYFQAKIQAIDEFLHFITKKRVKKKRLKVSSHKVFQESSSELARLLIIFEKRMLEELNEHFE